MSSNILSFLKIVSKLKHLKRTGWVNNKVSEPETVASHMYRMAIISFLVKDEKINKEKCIKLSIVHDLAESLVGDYTPHDKITNEEKYEKEKTGFLTLTKLLEESKVCKEVGDEMFSLWKEYEEGKTPEAILVKDIDKFDMVLQADHYEVDQNLNLEQFFSSTKGKFKHPFIQDLEKELYQQREERNKK